MRSYRIPGSALDSTRSKLLSPCLAGDLPVYFKVEELTMLTYLPFSRLVARAREVAKRAANDGTMPVQLVPVTMLTAGEPSLVLADVLREGCADMVRTLRRDSESFQLAITWNRLGDWEAQAGEAFSLAEVC